MAPLDIRKTTTADPHFLSLERLLDLELEAEYPDEMAQYAPHNKFKTPIKVVLIFEQEKAIACGAIKELGDHVEIKRMFVHPTQRGRGLSKIILSELEQWSVRLGYTYAILETGTKLTNAIRLYQSCGYIETPKYGPYLELAASICMKKQLILP